MTLPKVMSTRRQCRSYSHYQKEFLVYINEMDNAMEIAHALDDGNCRFLVHLPGSSNKIGFSSKMPCIAGNNIKSGIFRASLDVLTDRYEIMFVSRLEELPKENALLGVRKRALYLTTLRSKYMAWWDIKFSANRHCPAAK